MSVRDRVCDRARGRVRVRVRVRVCIARELVPRGTHLLQPLLRSRFCSPHQCLPFPPPFPELSRVGVLRAPQITLDVLGDWGTNLNPAFSMIGRMLLPRTLGRSVDDFHVTSHHPKQRARYRWSIIRVRELVSCCRQLICTHARTHTHAHTVGWMRTAGARTHARTHRGADERCRPANTIGLPARSCVIAWRSTTGAARRVQAVRVPSRSIPPSWGVDSIPPAHGLTCTHDAPPCGPSVRAGVLT